MNIYRAKIIRFFPFLSGRLSSLPLLLSHPPHRCIREHDARVCVCAHTCEEDTDYIRAKIGTSSLLTADIPLSLRDGNFITSVMIAVTNDLALNRSVLIIYRR